MLEVPGFDVQSLILAGIDHNTWRAVRLSDGHRVVLKVPAQSRPHPRSVARLRHEYELTRDLASEQVIHALEVRTAGNAVTLVLKDPGGGTLSDLVQAGGLPLPRFLRLATRLAAALGEVHALGLVHKDLKPASVVLLPGDQVRLTDFGMAMRLARHNVPQVAPGMLEGTLAYIAPEQTGRMNRPVDRRSDLYSLGVTLYELLTGVRPFRAAEPLELLHQHLALRPVSPREHRPELPSAVAGIVLKLLEKNPESRYQTAAGLQADLSRALSGLEAGGPEPFPLGSEDRSDEFRIPQQLFGRAPEVAALRDAMSRVARGSFELVLVHGPSGIGKSSLVGELRRESAIASAIQITGKCDQYNRELPYLGFLRAFAQLTRQMLTESEERLAGWRQELKAALAPNARLLTELVPEFTAVLGDVPEVPQLGLAESQSRFSLTIRRFLRAIATAEHPLVLFLDDVQWADGASIGLLQTLLADSELSHLLLVAAYRDDEIDAAHPFLQLVEDLQVAPARVAVGPLSKEALSALLAETLRIDIAAVQRLAETVLVKTSGNPFFVNEFLRSLHADEQIRFDAQAGRWTWDDDAIRRRRTTSNVVDLVAFRIRGLPEETQAMLRLGAVIGNRFELATLSRVAERSRREVAALIRPAIAADILVPLDDDFKYSELVDAAGNACAFLHDRVRQAAYGLIAEGDRPGIHRRAGWLLLDGDGSSATDRLFDAVNHLNAGGTALADDAERARVAELNLRASRKANLSMAWQAAQRYSQAGREMLGPAPWTRDARLAWDLGFELLRAAFLLGDHAAVDSLHEELIAHGPSEHAKALATEVKVQHLTSLMKYGEALDVAIPLLARLGVRLPRHGHKGQVVTELLRTKWALRGRDVPGLLELPQATDGGVRVAMRVLVTVSAAAYATEPDVFPQIVFRLVRMSLAHGNTPESAFGYVCYGLALCAVLGDYDGGLAFGRLALGMVDRLSARDLEARVRFLYALFIQVWSEPLEGTLSHFKAGANRGLETGDLEYYSYNFYGLDAHRLWTGADLAGLAKAAAVHHEAILAQKQEKVSLLMLVVRDAVAWLRGEGKVVAGELDEAAVLRLCESRGDKTSIGYCQTFRCMRAALDGDAATAAKAAASARAAQEGLDGQIFVPVYQFYESLALLALARQEGARVPWRVRRNQRRLSALALRVPGTFAARFEIVEGERARGRGRTGEALAHYEKALGHAAAAGNHHDLALAHQLAGDCLSQAGMEDTARRHLREAGRAWERWGASRLARRFARDAAPGAATSHDSSAAARPDELDLRSITRAASAVAEKLKLPDVVQELLSLALSSAGASRGVLVLADGANGFAVRATADVEGGVHLQDAVPLARASGLALGVVQFTLRTRAPTLVEDVARDQLFAADPHLTSQRPGSVLCLPLVRHGEATGALYLENQLVPYAFTPGRVEFITVLASQAAISIENAGLYLDLERSLQAQVALTSAHARFVPHQFLASLGRNDIREVRLGDHAAKVLSVLFSDIRGFTPLIESMTPAGSIEFINAYLAHMERPIVANHGFVDSYIGDAIMALFDGDADDAVAAGVGMMRALADFNLEREGEGRNPLRIGIGINTGPLMLGTIGGQNNLKCGVIGDSVNLAARVESLTKQLGVPFLIGEATVQRLVAPGRFSLRPIERVQVVGLKEPVTLYESFDADPPAVREAKQRTLPRFLEGMEAYRARRWADAAAALGLCVSECPQDRVAQQLSDRIAALAANAPGAEWDGVLRLTKK